MSPSPAPCPISDWRLIAALSTKPGCRPLEVKSARWQMVWYAGAGHSARLRTAGREERIEGGPWSSVFIRHDWWRALVSDALGQSDLGSRVQHPALNWHRKMNVTTHTAWEACCIYLHLHVYINMHIYILYLCNTYWICINMHISTCILYLYKLTFCTYMFVQTCTYTLEIMLAVLEHVRCGKAQACCRSSFHLTLLKASLSFRIDTDLFSSVWQHLLILCVIFVCVISGGKAFGEYMAKWESSLDEINKVCFWLFFLTVKKFLCWFT